MKTNLRLCPVGILALAAAAAMLFLAGCSTPVTMFPISRLEQGYSTSFFSMQVPEPEYVKQNGKNLTIPNATRDEVWDALMLVAMQRGPVLRASAQSGVLFAPPFVLCVENQTPVQVYACFMVEFYKQADDPSKFVEKAKVKPEDVQEYQDTILAQIATQVEAERKLAADGAWSYLIKQTRQVPGN